MSDPRFFPGLLLGVTVAAAIALLGWLLASQADPAGPRLFALGLAFPLGAGALTLTLFILSLIGMPLSLGAALTVVAGAVAILGLIRLSRSSKGQPPGSTSPTDHRTHPPSVEIPALVVIGLLFAASLLVSIGRSYSTWDAAAIWGVKGYGIARAGTVWAASDWGAYGVEYPLNIPLQVAVFAMLDGDLAPVSKLIFPLYYGSLALGLLAHFRRAHGRGRAWAVAFVLALPIVFDHATQGYANLPFATYLVLGCLLAVEAAASGRTGALALSGIALGLAIWTRPEGLFLVAAAYASLMLGARLGGARWKPAWVWFMPSLLIGAGWLVFGLANGESGPYAGLTGRMAASVLAGDPNLVALYWIGRYFLRDALRPSVWGVLVAVVAIGGALQWRRSRQHLEAWDSMILAAAAGTGAVVLAFYYLVSFSGNLEWWLDTGLSRMLLPSALLLAVWAVTPWLEPAVDPLDRGPDDGKRSLSRRPAESIVQGR